MLSEHLLATIDTESVITVKRDRHSIAGWDGTAHLDIIHVTDRAGFDQQAILLIRVIVNHK